MVYGDKSKLDVIRAKKDELYIKRELYINYIKILMY